MPRAAMWQWIQDILAMLAGVLCAWGGAELFVKGIESFAAWMRVPARLAGLTLAAFATSAPEVSVALQASFAGAPAISVGDVTGSNVVNIGLILALAVCIAPLRVAWNSVARDYWVALAVPVLLGALLWDGRLSHADGMILLAAFLLWLGCVIAEGLSHRGATLPAAGISRSRMLLLLAGGLVLLMAAGFFIVLGAKGMALRCGMSEFAVGAVIVAVATGTPELATTVLAQLRGHHELGLGNVLGSNLFNGLFIVALVALVAPFHIPASTVAPALVAGVLTTMLCLPLRGGITRLQGCLLLLVYAGYLVIVLQRGT